MSVEIDERVVAMKFDRKDFEKNVDATIKQLERLDEKLELKDAAKGFESIEKASKKVTLSSLEDSAEAVEVKFSTMSIVAIAAIERIVDAAIDAGGKLVKSMSIDQVSAGFAKYEAKINAVQATLNATRDQGKTLEDVNTVLEKLSWYTDETSYHFDSMSNALSQFIASGQKLEDAGELVMGIANACGLAGVDATKAEYAMNGFVKAFGQGYISNQVWQNQLKTSGITNLKEFRQILIDTAVEIGTLTNAGNGLYKTLKGNDVTVGDINTNLSDMWLNTNVMSTAFKRFSKFSSDAFTLYQETGMEAADAIKILTGSTYEFSEAGFKAAQEAKTFTDAIGAVKEAVSQRWSKTFELVIGNEQEAIELWTGVTEELLSVFTSAIDKRNEILKEWRGTGEGEDGRSVLFEGIGNIWTNLINIAEALSNAIHEIFPPVTGQTLLEMTKKFRDFTQSIMLSREALYSLQVIAKVLLIPFRVIFQLVRLGVKLFLSLTQITFQLANTLLYLFAVGNPIEDLLKKIFGLERYERLSAAISTLKANFASFFNAIAQRIRDSFGETKPLSVFLNVLNKIVSALAPIGNLILDGIVWAFEMLAKINFTLIERALSNIADFIRNIGSAIQNFFGPIFSNLRNMSFADLFNSMTDAVKRFVSLFAGIGKKNELADGLDDTSESGNTAIDVLKRLIGRIGDLMKQITPAKILIVGFGVALINLAYSITKTMDSISGLTSSLSAVAKAIKNRISPTINTVKSVGEAIVMVAGALALLASLDQTKLKSAAIILGVIVATLAALAMGFALINKYLLKEDFSSSMKSFTIMMLSLAASIAVLSGALMILNKVDLAGLTEKVLLMVGMIGAITLIMGLFAKSKVEISKGMGVILSYAAAVFVIAKAIAAIGQINTSAIVGSLGVVSLIVLLLKTIGESMANVSFGGAVGILLMCANLIILVKTLQKLSKYDVGSVIDGLGMYFSLLGVLLTLALIARVAGDETKKLTMTFLSMAAGILIMGQAIKQIGKLSTEEAARGTIAVMALMGMMALLIQVSKMSVIGAGFLSIAASIMVLMLAIKYLGNMTVTELVKGETAVLALMAMFAIIGTVGKKAEKSLGSILAMTLAIGTLTTAMMLLTLISFQEAMTSALALSAVLIAFGEAVGQLSKFDKESKFSFALVIKMGLLIGALAGAIGLLANMTNWQGALGAAASMSAVLLALTGALLVIKNSKLGKTESDIWEVIGAMAALGALATAIVGILSVIDANGIGEKVAAFAGISALLAGLGAVAAVVSEFPVNIGNVWSAIKGIALLLGGITLIIVALGVLNQEMNKIGFPMSTFASQGLELVKAMSPMLPIIAIAGAIAAALTAMPISSAAALDAMLAIAALFAGIVVITDVLGLIASNDTLNSLADKGLDLIVKIMGKIGEAVASFLTNLIGGSIKGVGSKIAEMVDEFGDIRPEAVEHFATVAHAMFEALSVIPTSGGMFKAFTGHADFDQAVEGFKKVVEGTIGMSDVINQSGEIDLNKLQNACDAAKKVLELVDILPPTGGILQTILGSPDLGTFGANLSTFGTAMTDYWRAISSLDDPAFKQIEKSASAGQFLAKLAKALPSSGGRLQEWFGEKDLTTFGNKLRVFGRGLVRYHEITASLNDTDLAHIKKTATAGDALADLNKKLPSTGGVLADWFFGSQDMTTFALGMADFASALIDLSNSKINVSRIQDVSGVGQALIDMYNSFEVMGGLSSLWNGDKDKSFNNFITQVGQLSSKLVEYSNTVSGVSSWESVDTSIAMLWKFVSLFRTINNLDISDSSKFGNALASLAEIGIADFTKAFADAEENFKTIGRVIVERVIDGAKAVKNGFYSLGIDLIEELKKGIASKISTVKQSGTNIGDVLLSAVEKKLDIHSPSGKFIRVAKFCILGLEKGFVQNEKIANNAASNVAEHFLQTMKDTLEIHSPSYRVRQEVARPVLEAFPAEFDENNTAEQAAKAKGEAIMEAFKSGFADNSEIRELMNLERELFELKLSPDLTDAQRQRAMDEYDAEYQRKTLETYVNDYKLAVQQYQTIVKEMGEESSMAKEAQKSMLEQEITLRKYAAEMITATSDTISAATKQSIENWKNYYEFLGSEEITRAIQDRLRLGIAAGDIRVLDEADPRVLQMNADERLQAEMDALNRAVRDGNWEEKYKSVLDPIRSEIFDYFKDEYVDPNIEKLRYSTPQTADDILKDFFDGMTIEEYSMRDVAADIADSFYKALREEMAKKAKETSSSISAGSLLGGYDAGSFDVGNFVKEALGFGDSDDSDNWSTPSGFMAMLSGLADKASDAISTSGDWGSSALDSAKNFVLGFTDGLGLYTPKATEASEEFGQDQTQALNDGLEERSPSRASKESALNFVLGFTNGLDAYGYMATEGATELANKVVEAFHNTANQGGINANLLEQVGYDFNPIITPQMDLSEIEAGVTQIDAMLSALEARALAFKMGQPPAENQNGSETPDGKKSTGTTVTFNQYNSSPKALDRVEIYRQTKNQLSSLKEGLKT